MLGLVAFVAINTLVFLGLAVGKVVPWPQLVPPKLLRAVATPGHGADEGEPHVARTLPQQALLTLVSLLARRRARVS
jgi:hypothetical protein